MSTPKFRLFAGPNGSGKTHLFEYLRSNHYINTELYINADKIEKTIKEKKKFHFNAYRVKVDENEFKEYIRSHSLYKEKIKDPQFLDKIKLQSGVLRFTLKKSEITSYHASFIATFLALKLLETNQSFCFETVMSHASKLELLDKAKAQGYKSYLYFIFTDNVETNIARVQLRVLSGYHYVDPVKIRSRYMNTFSNLPRAIQKADEAYVINNSEEIEVIAEKRNSLYSYQKTSVPKVILPYLEAADQL